MPDGYAAEVHATLDNGPEAGRVLTPAEVDSLVGQETRVTSAGDWTKPIGKATVKAAWMEWRTIHMTLDVFSREPHPLGDQPENPVGIGYEPNGEQAITLREIMAGPARPAAVPVEDVADTVSREWAESLNDPTLTHAIDEYEDRANRYRSALAGAERHVRHLRAERLRRAH